MNYPLFFLAFVLTLIDWLILLLTDLKIQKIALSEKFFRLASFLTLFIWIYLHSQIQPVLLTFAIGIGFCVLSISITLFNKYPQGIIFSKLSLIPFHFAFTYGLFQFFSPQLNLPANIVIILITVTSVQVFLRLSSSINLPQNGSIFGFLILFGISISFLLLVTLLTYTQGVAWRDRTALFLGLGGTFYYASEVAFAWNSLIHPFQKAEAFHCILFSLGIFGLALGIVTKIVLVII